MKKEETFLKTQPGKDDFSHLLADRLLTQMSDKQRIGKLKEVFLFAAQNNNDPTARETLIQIERAYQEMSRKFNDLVMTDFTDYLMGIYWLMPDTEIRADTAQGTRSYSTMLQTKFWILGKIASEWRPDYMNTKITEESIRAFRFLIAAFKPLRKETWPNQRSGESEFEFKARDRWVSKEEKEKILEMLRGQDDRFKPEELEFWMAQPHLPYEFERILAIARTRKGDQELWRKDIQNAKLVAPFRPGERTEAAINFLLCFGDIIAGIDRKVQELLKQMKASGWVGSEKIGGSEYVLGDVEIDNYFTLFKISLKIKVESVHPEDLVRDNFGRARRHIEKCLIENAAHQIILNMSGGETEIQLSETFSGKDYKD